MKDKLDYSPFLDQGPELSRPIKRMISSADCSPRWELDAAALFELENGAYVVICVSGCSCWPGRGSTTVYEANTIEQVFKDARKGEEYSESVKELINKFHIKRVK